MIAVICGGLVIFRLGLEVGQNRWQQLSTEEKSRLRSIERWTTSFGQLSKVLVQFGGAFGDLIRALGARPKPNEKGKMWVRLDKPLEKPPLEGSKGHLNEISTESKLVMQETEEMTTKEKSSHKDS